MTEDETEALIERWHQGGYAFYRGEPRPADDPEAQAGWDHAFNASKVRVVLPHRPEGYYHSKLED